MKGLWILVTILFRNEWDRFWMVIALAYSDSVTFNFVIAFCTIIIILGLLLQNDIYIWSPELLASYLLLLVYRNLMAEYTCHCILP